MVCKNCSVPKLLGTRAHDYITAHCDHIITVTWLSTTKVNEKDDREDHKLLI